MKIDKYAEILEEWSRGRGNFLDVKKVLSLDEEMKESETKERLIVYIQTRDINEIPLLTEIRCYPLAENSWCGSLDGTDERIEEAFLKPKTSGFHTISRSFGNFYLIPAGL